MARTSSANVFEGVPTGYKVSMVLSTIAGIAFVIAGFALLLGVQVSPNWFPVLSWGMIVGGFLGVFVFLSMYPALARINRPAAIVAVALGVYNYLYYGLNQALDVLFGVDISVTALGFPEVATPLLYDYPAALAILIIGGLVITRQDTYPLWFGVFSVAAALVLFAISPLGFFVITGIGLHLILLSTHGVWCLECVRRRFLLREREQIRERL